MIPCLPTIAKSCILACCSTLLGLALQAQTTLLPFGSTWKYLDNGSNQGTSWRSTSFNDGSWKEGPAELGYGDGDEATTVSYGSNSSNKYVTTYFRKQFNLSGLSNYTGFTLEFRRDDGIVVYVNGTEVKRDNMPTGTIFYNTLASNDASDDGASVQTATLPATAFVEGSNTIAVEIHQQVVTSSDISFDLQIKGNTGSSSASVVRGPYLQMGNQTAVTIRWRTATASNTKVKYGTVYGSLTDSVVNTTSSAEHEVRLSNLQPDTRYYYSIGTTTTVLEATDKNYFNTAPPTNTTRKIRIAAYGDCGNNSSNQTKVRDAYLNYVGSAQTDVWLLLGDNAYDGGFDNEYQTNFFNIYKDNLLKNILLFPTLGNHDYDNDPSRQDDHNIPYLANFTLPKNGECGGIASGKEEYYSFDYGDIHFICLDSYGKESSKRFYDTTSTQIQWLKNDLASNTRKWTIAYWHHPPYTMGSHNSDTESDLVKVRQNLIRILERYGVDLILNGHSHDYERSYFIRGHYGLENTFSFTQHAISKSSAKYDSTANSCPYVSTSAKTGHGTVYVVAGSAGQIGGTQSSFPHASSYYSNATTGGSLVLEIEGNRLDARFIAADKTIKDRFTMMKDANKTTVVNATAGQPLTLSASWPGNYKWDDGSTSRTRTVTPNTTTTYTVTDNATPAVCITDTFKVVTSAMAVATTENKTTSSTFSCKVYPNPSPYNKLQVEISSKQQQLVRYSITDLSGRKVQENTWQVPPGTITQTITLSRGNYILTMVNSNGERQTQQIVVE